MCTFNKVIEKLDSRKLSDKKRGSIFEKLMKEYYHIGWATVFKRIQRWFKLERKRPQKSLADVMERYLSKQAKYNCIILPLADNESQAQFK